jgi:1-acyl-sn-glycerol-3-phosphate acyltransferase
MVVLFQETEDMVLIIAPEGTRSSVQGWEGDFCHIAAGADLPALAVQLDYAKNMSVLRRNIG